MNEVPFLGEIGYVPTPKSFSWTTLLLWGILLVIVASVVRKLFFSAPPSDGQKQDNLEQQSPLQKIIA